MKLPLFTETEHCHTRRDGVNGMSCRGCRSSSHFRRSLLNTHRLPNNDINFDCPHGVPWPEGKAPKRKRGGVISAVANGAKSIIKTQLLQIDRVDDETHAARLATCDGCPDVIRKKGKPHRCGPMYESWKQQGGATCGCLLNLKARDIKQECPQGKWSVLENINGN